MLFFARARPLPCRQAGLTRCKFSPPGYKAIKRRKHSRSLIPTTPPPRSRRALATGRIRNPTPASSRCLTMPYRDLNSGGSQILNVTVDGYVFSLNQTKTVKSITLPNNSNLVLLSMMLANDPASASLATYYNRAGIYTDGTTFTNPPTGGLDGGGEAYSGTLLGNSQTWSNIVFVFGPVNATNVISCASQTITLPPGNYSRLWMLATGVQGNQTSQSFVVTYSDSTTTTFVQSLSDWFTPQNYAGESKAVIMSHRNNSDGTTDNRTFYLYGYSFALNNAKTVQSIRLPNNANVIVTAISLVPNWPPTFNAESVHPGDCQRRPGIFRNHRDQCQRLEWGRAHVCQGQRTGVAECGRQRHALRRSGQQRRQHELVRRECHRHRRFVQHRDALHLRQRRAVVHGQSIHHAGDRRRPELFRPKALTNFCCSNDMSCGVSAAMSPSLI